MARISAFKAILPAPGMESKVPVNIHTSDLKQQSILAKSNPHSYLNVIKPYLRLNEVKDAVKHAPYARSAMKELLAMKAIYQDTSESLYLYKQVEPGNAHTYIGLICKVPVADYYSGNIKVHEKTITEKEEQLILHIEATGAIGEPVLLTHLPNTDLKTLLEEDIKHSDKIIDFTDDKGLHHSVFRVTDPAEIDKLKSLYLGVGDLYIADGHHRSAASAGYFKKNNIENGHYLACIVPPEYLNIDSFHRAYKSDKVFSGEEFLNALMSDFSIKPSDVPVEPQHELEFGLLIGNTWYLLHFNGDITHKNAVEKLDVSILEDYVFRKVLGITDSKTDGRLNFIKGHVPSHDLEVDVNTGIYDAVFTVHPCNIQQVFDVADQGLIMPPKSTYIEPKLMSGLTVQAVND